MESQQSSIKDFDVLGKLGEGAFGQVFKVKRRADGKVYALKKVKIGAMKQKQRNNALNQIRILASYEGENIIGYKEAFYDEITSTLCIVMEFASEGDLLKKVQKHIKSRSQFSEQQIWTALVHMTQGLKSLHDKKILHRDLKCANIFITGDGVFKLGDLNVSKVLKKQMADTQTGTPYYASPEVWKDKPYGVKSDIWSLGCVVYEMAALKPPFTATDLEGLYKKICLGHFQRIPTVYSNELQQMIRSLLRLNSAERPTVEQILSNSFVHKHFKGEIKFDIKPESKEDLLKTIIYDPRNIKGLKNKLPKANYEENEEEKKVQEQAERRKKQQEEEAALKLKLYLQKVRKIEEEQRLREQAKALLEERQEISKKRERVFSACGVRKGYICDSPKKDLKTPALQNKKRNILPKLPPRPYIPGTPHNYKLPPKPINKKDRLTERSRQKSAERSRDGIERNNSKQNLRNAGQKIMGIPQPESSRVQRCSSAKKVVYPSWWN